nr:IMP dehydrogenase [uncultured Intestinibacter sp.]
MATIVKEGLTFDDVLLIPQKSEIIPSQIDIKTKLTKDIELNIPLMSASMDTVTESKMAISMARQGGIGIIHKNMSIEEQASEVDRVKRSESGVIVDPFSLSKDHTIQDADNIMARYKISGVPIVDENNILIGIITNRDIKFETDVTRRIEEAMTTKEHLVTAREGITLEEAKDILGKHRIEKLPIVDEEGHLKGLITIKDIEKKIQYPNSAKDKKGRLLCGAGVGITNDLLERVDALYKAKVDIIVLDSAHGHSQNVINALKKVKAAYPDLPVIAGNVATAAGCEDLIKAGADCVKIGMGPGSICTTRVVAGIGVPQITAIMDCYEVAKKYDIPIIADGGIQYSGDIVKALAAGANVCMMGSMFAGTEESPGEIVLYAGRSYKTYRGMGSIAAMEDGSKDRYFQSGQKKLVPEGVEGMVAYKGKAEDIVFQMIGGIKSGMGYCGAPTIEQLQANAEFVKITAASLKESHPHDIKITKEAPNYSTQGDMM